MASSPAAAALFFVIIAAVAISATARPCKTIFFITASNYPTDNHQFPNPNSPIQNPNPPKLTFLITEIHQFHRTRSFSRPMFIDRAVKPSVSKPYRSDQTMDVISIVGAVLFGAGSGAITAGVMYLIWSMCTVRHVEFESDSDEDEYYDVEDDVSREKNGYVAVETKEVPPSADEVDAMKG